MNIFYLNSDPKIAAIEHNDKHCVKMIPEYAQMLSIAHRELDGDKRADDLSMYKRIHVNHPCTVWTRKNDEHYSWLYQLFVALSDECTYRYEKKHSTDSLLKKALEKPPSNILKNLAFSEPPQCMPDKYKCKDTITAYRNFYNGNKSHFCNWKTGRRRIGLNPIKE